MTKEELKQKAEEWIKDHSGLCGSYMFVKYDYDSMQKAYLASAEPREKRIAELEAQIEKMKCCENCKRYKPCVTCNETVGNNCDYYSGGNFCNNWRLN